MASLVEFQEFKLNQHVFADTCDLQAFEDLLGGMELPTPPLSPDHAESTDDSTQLTAQPEGDIDIGETILQQMMASEDILFDSQGTYGSDSSDAIDIDPSILVSGNPQALLQDCMWNCDAYEPRHSISCNGVYTPAPSPPPEVKSMIEEEDEDHMPVLETVPESKEIQEEELEEDEESIMSSQVSMDTATDSSGKEEGVKSFSTKVDRENRKPSLCYRRSLSSSCNGSSRIHPQATTSESDEEIDVVTISDRPDKKLVNRMNMRKRITSASAPCSRHTSPSRMLSTKKRRCHSKRTHRLSSAGSNFGDGVESDDEQRRASHNVLERKRRNDLKYSFQILRGQIPELEDNQRAPKVTILKKAAEYIMQIREQDDDLKSRLAKERKRESKLLQRLAILKAMA